MMYGGLDENEVEQRKKAGEVNKVNRRYTKSVGRIVFDNLFTYFNILTFALFILVLFTGSWKNALFIGVVFSNAFTGIMQEIKSKKLIDKLSILTQSKVTVRRSGREIEIPSDEIVKDDILIVTAGNQISADCIVLESRGLETDESMLSGESTPIPKKNGDMLFSGSFAASGSAVVRVNKVGSESYAAQLTKETKQYKKAHSEIIGTINRIIRIMSFVIIPVGALLFWSQLRGGVGFANAAVGTVGAVVGMIPSGLVLISTVTMALGVLRCASHSALVQESAAIEVLARVDTLCIDKTGTLTDGSMRLREIIPLDGSVEEVRKIFAETLSALPDRNATAEAIIAECGISNEYKCITSVPFSSARKWSGVTFAEKGSYIIGAPEFILKNVGGYERYLNEGLRVIALVHVSEVLKDTLPAETTPVALAILSDGIKEDAAEVLKKFAENDVNIKVISGDSARAVSGIAARLGLRGAERYIDMSAYAEDDPHMDEIVTKYEIFGRVTPAQKKNIVAALKRNGRTVAMTGDGVNDVLAMREADCGIAMASGSDAARGVAKIVLVNSDFLPLVDVVEEGRRVINNLETVSSLYFTKTMFSLLLSLFFAVIGKKYPLDPIYLTLIGSVSIGMPSFFLALEKNIGRIKDGFKKRMYRNALPGSLAITAAVIGLAIAESLGFISESSYIFQSVWITGFVSLAVLYAVSRPINLFRGAVTAAMAVMYVGGLVIFGGFMGLPSPTAADFLLMLPLSVIGAAITIFFTKRRDSSNG